MLRSSSRLRRTHSAVAVGAVLVVSLTALVASAGGARPGVLAPDAGAAAASPRPTASPRPAATSAAGTPAVRAGRPGEHAPTTEGASPIGREAAPSVTASLVAALVNPLDTEVNPGDVLRYTVALANGGPDAALGLAYTGTLDANTTLVAGSLRVSPLAAADAYSGAFSGAAFPVPAATGLLANDYTGTPAATVATFGGGTVGGTAATNAAGATVAFGTGGSLTVNANGSFSVTPPTGFAGTLTFDYRLANSAGTDAATVTVAVTVPSAPVAVADGPAPGSAPGVPYHTALNTAYALAAPGVLANDTPGVPASGVVSFGGGSLGGTASTNAAGATVTFGAGGSLTANANGSVAFTPATGFTGLFTFQYRLQNLAGPSTATVTIAVGVRPAVAADTYVPVLVGNVPVNTATASQFSVLANDAGSLPVLAVAAQTNGTVVLGATGTFAFRPAVGYQGLASFTYTLTNGFGTTAPATVSLTVGAPVFFVNAAAAAGGDGRFDAPFNCLTGTGCFSAATTDEANDGIFLYAGAYTGGLTLLAGQRLVGQSEAASVTASGVIWPLDSGPPPATTPASPAITTVAAATNGVNLGVGNSLFGLAFGTATGSAIAGTGFGQLGVGVGVAINTAGQALNLTTGSLFGSFAQVRSAGGASNVALTGVATVGSVALGTSADALSGATGNAVVVDGGTGSFVYPGTVTTTSAGNVVRVVNKTGGAVELTGAVSGTNAAGGGVFLNANTGATVRFTGGLALSTGTAAAFTATGGGTVEATQNNTTVVNTLATTTGRALDVASTAVGSGGLAFRSVGVTAGASGGIVLNATGAAGGLTVTGTGAAGTGGTIRTTGGDAVALTSTAAPSLRYMALGETAAAVGEAKSTVNAVAGAGIAMTTVTGAVFRDLKIARTGSHGIVGTGVAGMTLADTDVLNAGDADNENGLEFASGASNLAGTATLTNVRVDGAASWGLRVLNTSGTLTLGVSGGQFTNTRNVPGGLDNVGEDGIQFSAQGTATITATVANATFATLESDGIQGVTSGTGLATLNLTATGNTFTGYRDGAPIPAVPAGNRSSDNAVELNATGTTRLRYTLAGNTMTNSENQAVLLGGNDASTVDGRVVNNVIDGTASNYGIEANPIADETASVRLLVDGNTVRNTELEAMTFSANLTGVLNLTVTNNTVPTRPRNLAATFEQIQARALGSSNVCWDVRGNTAVQGGTGAGPASGGVRLFRPSTATVLPRLERGSSPLGTPALTVAQNNNPAAATPFVVTSTVSVVENGTCVDPIATPTSLTGGTVALFDSPSPAAELPAEALAETRLATANVTAGPAATSIPTEPTAEMPAILPTAAPEVAAAPVAAAPVEIAPPTLAVDAAEKAVGGREPAALEAAASRAAPADGQRSGETVTATIGTLPAGKTVTVFYDATLAAPFPAGYGVTATGAVSGSNVATLALQRFTPVVQTLTRTRVFAGVPAPDADAGWRLLAAPVTGLTVATLAGQNLVQGIPGYYPTYGANLLTDFTGSAFVAPTGGANALAPGRGFFWYFYDRAITPPGGPSQSVPLPFTLTGTGVATSGPVTVPLRVGVQNMLGNPFTSALDVSGLATWATGGTVQAVGQVYDDATQSYLPTTLTGDRVEVWQGLFVGVNTATALVVPPAAQIAPAALADGEAGARAEPAAAKAGATETRLVAFELRGTAAGTGQPTVDRAAALYFHPDATPDWDAYDVAKLFPPTAAFALLAFEGPHDGAAAMKAQESRPFELAGSFAVPLHVDVQGTAGPLTLTWPLLQNVPAEWSLRLTDVVANQTVDLRAASSYTFDAPARPATAADGAPLGAVAGAVGERFVLTVSSVATGPESPAAVPGTFALAGMLPNPVRDAARVRFDVPEAAAVTVEVFDVLGRLAATVVDGPVAAGRHDVAWRRGTFPSGTYVLRMRARPDGGGAVFEQTRRMTVAR